MSGNPNIAADGASALSGETRDKGWPFLGLIRPNTWWLRRRCRRCGERRYNHPFGRIRGCEVVS